MYADLVENGWTSLGGEIDDRLSWNHDPPNAEQQRWIDLLNAEALKDGLAGVAWHLHHWLGEVLFLVIVLRRPDGEPYPLDIPDGSPVWKQRLKQDYGPTIEAARKRVAHELAGDSRSA